MGKSLGEVWNLRIRQFRAQEEPSSCTDWRNDDRPRYDSAAPRLLPTLRHPVDNRHHPAGRRCGVVVARRCRAARWRQKSLVLVDDPDAKSVSPPIRRAAAWSWRLLVIFAAVVVVFEVLRRFGLIVVPVALALTLAAMLLPAVDFLDR